MIQKVLALIFSDVAALLQQILIFYHLDTFSSVVFVE
jgi:hypothetical protein